MDKGVKCCDSSRKEGLCLSSFPLWLISNCWWREWVCTERHQRRAAPQLHQLHHTFCFLSFLLHTGCGDRCAWDECMSKFDASFGCNAKLPPHRGGADSDWWGNRIFLFSRKSETHQRSSCCWAAADDIVSINIPNLIKQDTRFN